MTDDDSNNTGDDGALLPWYDYEPGAEVPNHVKYLRIGVQQALAAAEKGSAPRTFPLRRELCNKHPNLQMVEIHVHTVEYIPCDGFGSCPKLERVEFVATTTGGQSSIAAAASNLPVQSPRITRIGDNAFHGCGMLHSVIGLENVSCSLERIDRNAFGSCPNLVTLDLSCLTRLQFLGLYSFFECKSLTVVDLSNSVLLEETINEYSFWQCTALRILHLPTNLKRINRYAFFRCSALVNIVIPASVEFMLSEAFSACSSLTRVTFQSTRHLRTLMGDGQFLLCTSLHTLELEVPPIQRKLWPLLMEQFLGEGSGILSQAGIPKKQRITIGWNFVRTNIANFYVREKKCQKRDIVPSVDND